MVDLKVIVVLGGNAAALGRQVELAAPGTDVLANALFANPIVGRGVDKVDAGIENGIEELVGSLLTTRTPQVFGPRIPILP